LVRYNLCQNRCIIPHQKSADRICFPQKIVQTTD
jgi:hypothetical protein